MLVRNIYSYRGFASCKDTEFSLPLQFSETFARQLRILFTSLQLYKICKRLIRFGSIQW